MLTLTQRLYRTVMLPKAPGVQNSSALLLSGGLLSVIVMSVTRPALQLV